MSKTPRESRQRIPHLHLNRLGIWCFRLTMDGQTRQKSLGTKDRALAIMLASKLNWELSMTKRSAEPTVADIIKAFKKDGREFDAEFPDGTKLLETLLGRKPQLNTIEGINEAQTAIHGMMATLAPEAPAKAAPTPKAVQEEAPAKAHRPRRRRSPSPHR